ncbi:MAG: hydrogenase expression/formation protein HypE [Polyangiaceae bacterium]
MSGRDPQLFARIEAFRRRAGRVKQERIELAHGGGGKAMRDLLDDVVKREFGAQLQDREDQARLPLTEFSALGTRLAFTTDSYVITPLEFPGGDIGRLAVNGTLNDLAVGGARPLYLSCGLVIEEGLEVSVLRRILRSMAAAAEEADVRIVTGDTKVVPRGAADRLFINTAGVGVIRGDLDLGAHRIEAGDVVLVNGFLGDHGAAVLLARGELQLNADVRSDCATLHGLVAELLNEVELHSMRDLTRGGLAAVLNELALASEVGMVVDAAALPVRAEVSGLCELLGLDPVHLANEGKLVVVLPARAAERALEIMRGHPLGREAALVGRCTASPPGLVTIDTGFGGERVLDMLVGEPLPRIC